jgi:glycosyltransferase involved in cell wall biosynthesis
MHFFAGDTKPVQRMWKERYTRYREDRIRISEYADGFTVATEPLKKIVEQYTKAPVIAVPNSIDVPSWNRFLQDKKRAVPPLTIGWAGGTRDEKDFTIVAQAWKQVAELCPEVTFVVMGHISDALVKAVPKNRIVTIPWVELEEYPGNLLNFDIGCCALEEVPWNENKSANRWYEQTMSGVASVVSPIVYGREVTDGVDALIASTVEDWVRHLVALVDSRDLRLKLAANAKKTILNLHTTDQNAMKWMEAWVEIVEKARARRGLPSPHALRMA